MRPNVLVIVADQLRADHLGHANKDLPISTPHIDAIALDSRRFTRAYVANPTCMPNRATIATGRWPSVHGTRTNGVTLDWQAETFMRSMRRTGYKTSAIGKLHFQTMGWPYEGFQLADIEAHAPEVLNDLPDARDYSGIGEDKDWQQWENSERHREGYIELPTDYYGFDTVDLAVGHGDRPSGHYWHWAKSRGANLEELAGWQNSKDRRADWDQVYVSQVPAELHPSSFVVERATARLKDAASSEDPFLCFVSFPDPHHPFAPPEEFMPDLDPAKLPLPETFFASHSESPPHLQQIAAHRGTPPEDPTMTWAPTVEQFQDALRAQIGQIQFVDQAVGKIVSAAREATKDRPLIIVFTTDHGDLFGDHGLMLKHFVHYEAVTRVPLLISGPMLDMGIDDRLVSSADIAPTLLELTGCRGWRGIQGRSLVSKSKKPWRDALIVEEDQPFGLEGMSGPVRLRTLITPEYRLTAYAGQEYGELYDRSSDAGDGKNLFSIESHKKERGEAFEKLAREMMAIADEGRKPMASA